MPYVTVGKEDSGDIELYYEDHGSGQPVVLIHGYPLSGASWEKQLPVLLEAGYRVITYDRRGFGKSSQPTAGYDYDTFAEDLHKLLTDLKLRDFTLVGFSMGGGEVARYVGKYGSKGVSKAVIISGVPPYLLKTADNPEGVDGSVFAGIEKAVAADRYAFFSGFFQNFYNTDQFLGKRVSEQAIQASWNVAAGASATATLACVATWHEDFREDLARIDVPTLVIQGDADRILPVAATGLRIAKFIKGARQVVVRDGPHCIPWTHVEEVNAVALLDDQVGPAQLQPARIQAPDAQALLARVEVRPDEQFTAQYPRELSARITIHTKDQRTLVKKQLGWEGDLANLMSWERTVEKFHWLSERFADEDLRSRLISAVQQLDARPISDLMDLLAQVRPAAAFPAAHPGIQ
jgi:non-heme chloroperoxidase